MSKLAVDLSTPNEIKMTRDFDAPKALVIRAMTTPELIKKWLGGKRAVVTDATQDFRVGGSYRHGFRTHDGFEFAFVGRYLEIGADRIVHTEQMEGAPGEARITVTFAELTPETTRMTMVMAFPSQAFRDQVVATGMSDGAGESYDELETLVRGL